MIKLKRIDKIKAFCCHTKAPPLEAFLLSLSLFFSVLHKLTNVRVVICYVEHHFSSNVRVVICYVEHHFSFNFTFELFPTLLYFHYKIKFRIKMLQRYYIFHSIIELKIGLLRIQSNLFFLCSSLYFFTIKQNIIRETFNSIIKLFYF